MEADAPLETVAVVMVNRNKRDFVVRALHCVSASAYGALRIVLVDDCSTDDSVTAVRDRFPDVRVIAMDEHRGAPGIRNVGIREVLSDAAVRYVLLLDNDAFMQPDALESMLAVAREDSRIGVVAPKAFRDRETRVLYSAGEMRVNLYTGVTHDVGAGEADAGQYDEERDIRSCASFAMLVRREVFEKAGLFDEAFFPYGWEDAEFTLRASKHGFRIRYAPKSEVEHLGGKIGRGPIPEYEAAKARNLFRLMSRHANMVQWACFLCVLPMRAVAMAYREVRNRGLSGVTGYARSVCGAATQPRPRAH